jgi:alkylhydroperoxidase family enzyme
MSESRASGPAEKTGNVVKDSPMGLIPETVSQILKLNGNVWRESLVPPAILETIRLRNARTVNCVFCKSVRYDVAIEDGLTEDRVSLINDSYRESALPVREKAAITLADCYLGFPAGADHKAATEIASQYSEDEVASMLVAVMTYNFTSRMAVSLGGMPEDGTLPIMQMSVSAASA